MRKTCRSEKENLFLKKRRHSLQRESTRGISIHRRTSESICHSVVAATFGNLSECLFAQWSILPIPRTTMYVRILITVTVRHSKRGIRHKLIGHSCCKNA